MKVVFYEDYDFEDVIKSYLLKYTNKKRIFVLDEYYIDFTKIFFEENRIKYCDPNEVSSNLFECTTFLRFIKSTIFFCERGFSIEYFFEIINFLQGEKVQEYCEFFEKNLIDWEFTIDEILGFDNLSDEIELLFQEIISWKKKFSKFYCMVGKRTFRHFFSIHAFFLNELLRIFDCELDFICNVENLNSWASDSELKISVNTYFEYAKSESDIRKGHDLKYSVLILNYKNLIENKSLLNEENTKIFYCISSDDVLKSFLESTIIEQVGSHKKELLAILPLSLKDQIDDNYMRDLLKSRGIRLCSFNNPFKKEENYKLYPTQKSYDEDDSEEALIELYREFANEELIKKEIIKLNSFSVSNLMNNELKFFEKDVLDIGLYKKNNADYLIAGYFDSILEKVIKQFFAECCNEERIIPILLEILKKTYHDFYINFIFEKMEIILLNFLDCYRKLNDFAREKNYKIEFMKKINYDLRLAVRKRNKYLGEKKINTSCSVFCFLCKEGEIILYDVFSKSIDSTGFRNFKKPNIVLAGSYFLRKFPGVKLSLKYFNLDVEKNDLKEKSVRGVNDLIVKIEENVFKKINSILNAEGN